MFLSPLRPKRVAEIAGEHVPRAVLSPAGRRAATLATTSAAAAAASAAASDATPKDSLSSTPPSDLQAAQMLYVLGEGRGRG